MTMHIKRITIIGNCGSGKSTLTRRLHQTLHLPVYHLDQYFWQPNWVRTDPEEYKKIHDALCDQDEWIIDGINLRLLEHRIQRADVIIFLDIPRYICFWRIFKRTLRYYGKETPSSPKGCPERLGWEFILFLKWVWNFNRKHLPDITLLLHTYANKKEIHILRSEQEIDALVKQLKEHN